MESSNNGDSIIEKLRQQVEVIIISYLGRRSKEQWKD